MHFDDEPWDEDEWEEFLRERDDHIDRSMRLLNDFLDKHPRPAEDDAEALAIWKEHLRAFVDSKGWTPGDMALPFIWLDDEDDAPTDDADGEWLGADEAAFDDPLFDDALFDDLGDFDDLDAAYDHVDRVPVYQAAMALTTEVIDWSHGLPAEVKDGTFVQFCALITQIPAKIAKGHGIGFEQDMIGGNIACVKRALAAANQSLDLLQQMKRAPHLSAATYRALYEALYELRNALGLYVQELREQFNLGID